jgi:protein-tyrosine phosphatase
MGITRKKMLSRFLFPKRQSKKADEELRTKPDLKVDIHSHLLPGIDDGARTLEESLQMLTALSALGYRLVVTTPHVMADTYNNSTQKILQSLALLQKEAHQQKIDIDIRVAAEYYMDEELLARVKSNDILTIGSRYLLFETSYFTKPNNFDELLYEIQAKGYEPLLAHPERYRYIEEPFSDYHQLKEKGVLFQLDLNSLSGHYGKSAQKKAHYLIENHMIDFVGSDAHRAKQIGYLKETLQSHACSILFDKNEIKNNALAV